MMFAQLHEAVNRTQIESLFFEGVDFRILPRV